LIVNGYLGAGKTTVILNLLKEISEWENNVAPPRQSEGTDSESGGAGVGRSAEGAEGKTDGKKKYKVVWLKNEFGINEVDTLAAKESALAGVNEILNGCLCCTLVGLIVH